MFHGYIPYKLICIRELAIPDKLKVDIYVEVIIQLNTNNI